MSPSIVSNGVLTRLDQEIGAAFANRLGENVPAESTVRRLSPIISAVLGTGPIVGPPPPPINPLVDAARQMLVFRPNLSYAVGSYWSPISRERYSVCHIDHRSAATARERAAAGLFFALSHQAGYTKKYRRSASYTATHFMVTFAKHAHSWPIRFAGRYPKIGPEGWTIPIHNRDDWLRKIGWADILDDLEARFKRSPASGARLIDAAISHKRKNAKVAALGKKAMQAWQRALTQGGSIAELGAPYHSGLQAMWSTDQLTIEQAAFMTASYLLWHEAVPRTACAYTFPCHVSDTCCVLTAGCTEAMQPHEAFFLSWLGKTLFVHPLVRDYAANAKDKYIQDERELWCGMYSHSLAKIVLPPAKMLTSELRDITHELGFNGLEAPGAKEAVKRGDMFAHTLYELLQHYSTYFRFMFDPSSATCSPGEGAASFSMAELEADLQQFFNRIICMVMEKWFPGGRKSELILHGFGPEQRCHCDKTNTRELLVNLLLNAARQYARQPAADFTGPGLIEVIAVPTDEKFIRFVVTDSAGGFGPRRLAIARRKIRLIESQKKEFALITTTKSLLQRGPGMTVSDPNRTGNGLVFCAFYLRQLEFRAIQKAGQLILEDIHGGARITVVIPRH